MRILIAPLLLLACTTVFAGTPLPEGAIPWKTLWSAGQGIDQIHDVPDVATLCARLADEYRAASRHTNQQETP